MNGASASRRAALAALFVLLGCAGIAELAACDSFGEAATASDAAAASPDGAVEAAPQGGGAFSCLPGAFCDSFDEATPLPRDWSSMATRLLATQAVVPDAGLDGSGALVVTARVADGGVPGAYQSAQLRRDIGVGGPTTYTLVVAYAARADPVTSGVIQGPRFSTQTGTDSRELIVEFRDGYTRLNTYAPSCDGGCKVDAKETLVGREWHHYVLTIEAHPTTGDGYGTITYEIDGTVAVSDKLPFPLSAPSKYGMLVGLTYASPMFAGTMTFDDVSILLTPSR